MLASRPSGPPKGCSLTRAIVRSFLSCRLPPPSSFGSHSGPCTTPRRRRTLGKEAAATERARRAPRCLPAFRAHRCPPFPHSLAPGGLPRRRQPSTCEGKAPGLPPLLPGRRVPIASRRQRSSPGRGEGPPGSGAGQGAGPWKGKARDREGLTQATLRALRSLRKGRGRLASKRGPRAEEGEVQTKAKEGRDDSS